MTGKLIKYEFHSIMKIMGIVWAALPVMALIAGFFGIRTFSDSGFEQTPYVADVISIVSIFLFGGIFMAMIAVTLLVILLRFYKGLLRDEGYLMHTLPVKTWQLITAKGVVAVCVTLISIAAAFLSILLLTAFEGSFASFGRFAADLFRMYVKEPADILITVEILVLTVVWITVSIYKTYAAMAIGQLAKRHRILLSVAAYMGIDAAGMIILSVIGDVLSLDIFSPIINLIFGWVNRFDITGALQTGLIVLIIIGVIQVAVFHIISEQILRKKLNLE